MSSGAAAGGCRLFALFLGALMFGAFAIGGDVGQGAISFGIMAVLGALFPFGAPQRDAARHRRPGARRALGDDRPARDAPTGLVLITFVIGAWLYEVARGEDGNPYALMGAIGGPSYVLSVAVLRRRG